MGFTLGATSSHAALRHARIGGISWGRHRNVHQGERAALQHAVAVGAPLRFLVVDTTPLVYSLAARIAGQPLAAAAASAALLDTVNASAAGTRVPRDLSVLAETGKFALSPLIHASDEELTLRQWWRVLWRRSTSMPSLPTAPARACCAAGTGPPSLS
jgi:hypothetical protein